MSESPSLVARLEALQLKFRDELTRMRQQAWIPSFAEERLNGWCADALDPILALARQLEAKAEDDSRVDGQNDGIQ